MAIPSGNFLLRVGRGAWNRLRDFGGAGDATYLWPRWIVLRAVGLVFVIAFAGIIEQVQVLAGPHGLIPLGNLQDVEKFRRYASPAKASVRPNNP